MKLQHVLFLSASVLSIGSAHAERTLWTETATIRTKTIFGDDGSLLYQKNWNKRSGDAVGQEVDLRNGASAAPATSYQPPPTYSAPPNYQTPQPAYTMAHPMGNAPPMGTAAWGTHAAPYPVSPAPRAYAPQAPQYPVQPTYQAPQPNSWVQGPFQAQASGGLQVGAPQSGIVSPEGFQNPHPEWSRLYKEAQAPLPERSGYSLPAPPPMYPGSTASAGQEAPLVGRPLHPDIPGQGEKRWFNRVGGKVLMRPDNMVRVKVLDKLGSKRNKRGDTFRYVLLDPIMYGLRTLVPAGTKGVGRVGRAKNRGFFGRPGLLDLEFGSVDLPGATPARIYLAETVISPAPREPEAIGAGTVGLLAFGPLGVAGGALIRGHDVNVESGSVFHVEVAVDVPYMHTASR